MKYYKIYKNCVRVGKAYHKMNESDFTAEVEATAWDDFPEDAYFRDHLTEEEELHISECWRQARSEFGLDCGDYKLYCTEIEDMYDIPRSNC